MKHLLLCLALFGCSKSSAKPSPSHESKIDVVVESAGNACDDACTSYGQCYEFVYTGESFRGGEGCVETCQKRPVAEQVAWAKELAEAVKTNLCAKVMAEEEGGGEDDDEAGMADGEPTVTLPTGSRLGCFGWSMQLRTAACIVGQEDANAKDLKLAFIGAESIASIPLGGDASKADETLEREGFGALKVAPTRLVNRKPKTLNGATLRFTTIQSPEKNHYALLALLNGQSISLFEEENEGLTVTAKVRAIGADHVLVELASHIAREGEVSDRLDVILLDTATGKVAR